MNNLNFEIGDEVLFNGRLGWVMSSSTLDNIFFITYDPPGANVRTGYSFSPQDTVVLTPAQANVKKLKAALNLPNEKK